MIKAIDHIGILTKDLQQSVEFYTDVLGFSISNKIEMADVGLSAIFIEKNGSTIELMGYRGAIPKRSDCLLYTSDADDDLLCVDLGGRRIIKKKKKKKQKKNDKR